MTFQYIEDSAPIRTKPLFEIRLRKLFSTEISLAHVFTQPGPEGDNQDWAPQANSAAPVSVAIATSTVYGMWNDGHVNQSF